MPASGFTINGWTILLHPMLLGQIAQLREKVSLYQEKHPADWQKKNATKVLAAINKLAFQAIPQDPSSSSYRQGNTLGTSRKHWFRAKFFQQYRLFFRYDLSSRIIIYAWVNDDNTKRAYGSRSDAYAVFSRLLDAGTPPDSWDELLKESERAPGPDL